MRHRKSVVKLGRSAAHRKATMANLSAALFERKHITTTETKAKATRRYSERLITLAKKQTVHARRLAMAKLRQKKAVSILFDEVAPEYTDRPGGYTRVIKLGQRQGDGARMAVIELVGFEAATKKKKQKDKEREAKADTKPKKKKKEKGEEIEEVKAEAEVKEETVEEKKQKKKATAKKDVKEEVSEAEKKPKAEAKAGGEEKKTKKAKESSKKSKEKE